MACLCGGGTTTTGGTSSSSTSQTGTTSQNTSGTSAGSSRQVLPQWLLDRLQGTNSATGTYGATPSQTAAQSFLNDNLTGDGFLTPSYGVARDTTGAAINQAGAGAGAISSGINYLQNAQNNPSNTLRQYFGDWTGGGLATTAPDTVSGHTGAEYAGAYDTPLTNDYVNGALSDFDTQAGRGFNALRAANADAFGNKRTGVAQGVYQADSDKNRAALDSTLRYNAFNTAAGYGQQDAGRALTADTVNAGNQLNTNQFNSAQQSQRQEFDLGQADKGDAARVGTANDIVNAGGALTNNATAAGALGTSGLNNTINFNNTRVGNANAAGAMSNMTWQQLMQLLQAGGMQIGTDTTGNTTGTMNGTTNVNGTSSTTSTGTSTAPGDIGGTLAKGLAAYAMFA